MIRISLVIGVFNGRVQQDDGNVVQPATIGGVKPGIVIRGALGWMVLVKHTIGPNDFQYLPSVQDKNWPWGF